MAFLLTFLGLLLQILWLAILVRVILSWFPVDPSNPIIRIVWDVTEPILAPFRRVIGRASSWRAFATRRLRGACRRRGSRARAARVETGGAPGHSWPRH